MDTELEPTISALHSNVLSCRDVADLALLSAEQLEQLAHTLEREAWESRLRASEAAADECAALTETERRLLSTLTEICAAWVRLMRLYCSNVESAFAANPRLAAALPPGSPLHELAVLWSEIDERMKRLVRPQVEPERAIAKSRRDHVLSTAPAAAALGCDAAGPGH